MNGGRILYSNGARILVTRIRDGGFKFFSTIKDVGFSWAYPGSRALLFFIWLRARARKIYRLCGRSQSDN